MPLVSITVVTEVPSQESLPFSLCTAKETHKGDGEAHEVLDVFELLDLRSELPDAGKRQRRRIETNFVSEGSEVRSLSRKRTYYI